MYILAKLIFLNYIPDKLSNDMIWQNDYGEIYKINTTGIPLDIVIEQYGYPVKPYIMPISANPDDYVEPLVHPEQIGWWDEGPHSDELRDIEIKDFNYILQEEDGIIQLEVNIDTAPSGVEYVTPELYMDKVTIGIAIDESIDDEDDNFETE